MNKLKIINIIPKKFHKFVLSSSAILIIASVTFILCLVIFSNNSDKQKTATKLSEKDTGTVILTAETELEKQANSPESGPLDYQFVSTYNNATSDNITYIYTTTEYRDDRLIELNNQVISDLIADEKINDQTQSYSVSYFNNREIAYSYLDKVDNNSLSTHDKLILKDSYIASMTYSKKLKLNFLIKIGNANILKRY